MTKTSSQNPSSKKTSPEKTPSAKSRPKEESPIDFIKKYLPKNLPRPKLTLRRFALALLLTCWAGLSIIISELIVSFVFTNFITSGAQLAMPLYSAIYSAVMYLFAALIMVLVPWLLFKTWRPNREELGLSGAPTWTDILLAPAALIIYFLLAAVFVSLFTILFPWFQLDQAQDVGFDNLTTAADLLIAFITLVVVAPVAEEFIFRGWLYGKLRTRVPLPLAILFVSLLFAFLHGQWNVAVNVFAMSIILCLQRELTGTIYSGILLHMLKNGIAFYLLFVATA